jgi:hypothetical protein
VIGENLPINGQTFTSVSIDRIRISVRGKEKFLLEISFLGSLNGELRTQNGE